MIPQAALQTMVTSVDVDCRPVINASMPEPCVVLPADSLPRAAPKAPSKHGPWAGPLYRREVVGRKLSIYRQRGKAVGEDAKVLEYNEHTQLHKVRFTDRSEDWVNLSEVRFKWLSGPPPGAAANATWRGSLAKDAAVGRRVRVYWPGGCSRHAYSVLWMLRVLLASWRQCRAGSVTLEHASTCKHVGAGAAGGSIMQACT